MQKWSKHSHVEHVGYDNVAEEDLSKATCPEARFLYQVLKQLQDLVQVERVEEEGCQQTYIEEVVEVVEAQEDGGLMVLSGDVEAHVDHQRRHTPETDDDQRDGSVFLVLQVKIGK